MRSLHQTTPPPELAPPASVASDGHRLDLACLTGIDPDLIIGADDESAADAAARHDALTDMLDAGGFILPTDLAHASALLTVLASLLDDPEVLIGGCVA